MIESLKYKLHQTITIMEILKYIEIYYNINKYNLENDKILHFFWPDCLLKLKKGQSFDDIISKCDFNMWHKIIKAYTKYHYFNFHGEYDHILSYKFPINYKGVFVEVGTAHYINQNNSYYFEQNGWDCYCFEPNPTFWDDLSKHRKKVFNYAIGNKDEDNIDFFIYKSQYGETSITGLYQHPNQDHVNLIGGANLKQIIKVNKRTLNTVLPINLNIDILAIDVEESELQVLQGIDLYKFKPKIIVLENLFGKNECKEYLIKNGYELYHKGGINDFFKPYNFDFEKFIEEYLTRYARNPLPSGGG